MNQVKYCSLEQRLAQLYSRIDYERQNRATSCSFKLLNMRVLLERLGDPHLQYPVIHVAGTKGKGSVATLVGSILTVSGRQTGVYTSPHLDSIHQRMAIDGKFVTDQQLLDVLNEINPLLVDMDRQAELTGRKPLTFFEVTTAAMFFHFAKQNVDMAVVEVGLGGRLDSTNVCQPQVCVITNISYDHTHQLGNTLEEIAAEKAGIIKPGVPVISGAINPSAACVISHTASKNDSPLYVIDQDFSVQHSSKTPHGTGTLFSIKGDIRGERFAYKDVELSMLGSHQATNAGIAIAVSQLLRQTDKAVSETTIRAGLRKVSLIGRTEVVAGAPTVVIDMAHNVASIVALVESLQQLSEWHSAPDKWLVMATSRDKDARGMLRSLVPHFDEIVFTRYQSNPRGKPPDQLLEIAVSIRDQMNLATRFSVELDPKSAWRTVRERSGDRDLICISGSVFLVAELRKTVLHVD